MALEYVRIRMRFYSLGVVTALIVAIFATASRNAAHASETHPQSRTPDALHYEPPADDLILDREAEREADALSYFVQGLLIQESAQSDEALAAFRKTLDIDPGYTELAERVAAEYLRRGDKTTAIDVLKDAALHSKDSARPHLFLATIYLRDMQRPAIALDYAQKARSVEPENPEVYQALYEIHLATGQPAKALDALSGALDLEIPEPDYWLRIGELHTTLLVPEDGEAKPEDIQRINAIYEKAMQLAGEEDPIVLTVAADYFIHTRQIAKAIPLYLRVLELDPADGDNLMLAVREKLARSFLVTGQRSEAMQVLEDIIKADPTRHETYEFLAQLQEEEKNYLAALGNYEQSLLLNAFNPFVYFKAGELALMVQEPDRAVATLEQGRKLFPDLPAMTYSLAVAYTYAERYPLALAMFENAMRESSSGDGSVINAGFYFNYASAAEQAGDYNLAAEMFQRSINLDPSNAAPALNYLAYMWAERGERLEEAEALVLRALEVEPDSGAYLDTLGWIHFKRGDYEKALPELLRAAGNIETPDPIIFDHIGDAYEKLEDLINARKYWKMALELAPTDEDIREKLEKEALTSSVETP